MARLAEVAREVLGFFRGAFSEASMITVVLLMGASH